MDDWTHILNNMPFEEAAKKLGMTNFKRRWKPCPACGESKSGKRDSRPPIRSSIKNNRAVWTCYKCKQYGDILDLLSLSKFNCRARDLGPKFHQLKALLDIESTPTNPKPLREVLQYPPPKEILKLLKSAKPISGEAAEYLKNRGIEPDKALAGIADPHFPYHSLTKVESSTGRMIPFWPQFFAEQFPLILPKFDWKANLMTLHGRAISEQKRKTTAPIGFDTGETFFLSFGIRKWLKKKQQIKSVWIAEGEIDFLSIAQFENENVIGLSSAAFGTLQLMPWTNDIKVYIATDADKTGEQYAQRIQSLISPAQPIRITPQG